MEGRVCVCCDKEFTDDDSAILLDKRLRKTLDPVTVTGVGLCPDCNKEGFICLIEIDSEKSDVGADGTLTPEGAYRTGRVAHLKSEAFYRVFSGVTMPPHGFIYIDEPAFSAVVAMAPEDS